MSPIGESEMNGFTMPNSMLQVCSPVALTGASVSILTGLLTREVVDIRTDTIDNVSTLVYELESSGTFNYNGATIVASGFNVGGDLEVDLEMEEVIRASDLSQLPTT